MRLAILLLFTMLLSVRGLAQRYDHAFNRITTEDGKGLRSNYISALYQDEKGFIWIGNNAGGDRKNIYV